jgi:hypothetical protein
MNNSLGNPLEIGKYYIFPGFIGTIKLVGMDATNNGIRIQPRGRKPVPAMYLPHNRPVLQLNYDDPWTDVSDDKDDGDFEDLDAAVVKRRKTYKKKKRYPKRGGKTRAKRGKTRAKR